MSFDTLIVKVVMLKERGTDYVDRNPAVDYSRFEIGG